MDTKRGIARGASAGHRTGWPRQNSEKRAHLVVHTRIIRVVRDVEALSRKQKRGLLADPMLPAQPQVEAGVTRAQSGVASRSDGALIGRVIVAVDLSAREQIEWVPAVVGENRSKLETSQDAILLPRAVKNACDHNFVSLVERGQRTVKPEVCGILRTVVAVEVCRGVVGLAVGIVSEQRKVVLEALADF